MNKILSIYLANISDKMLIVIDFLMSQLICSKLNNFEGRTRRTDLENIKKTFLQCK
jgi:hypothetical protein